MRLFFPATIFCAFALLAAQSARAQATGHPVRTEPLLPKPAAAPGLPPCPPGVTDLKWTEFFKMPIGPLGMELTDKARSLDGKRVRLLGYMVRRETPTAGSLILMPVPESVEEDEAGFADLSPQAVRVIVPGFAKRIVPYTPRPLLLIGTLSIGNRAEPGEASSGAVSLSRLTLDPPPAQAKPAAKAKRAGR